MDFGWGPGVPVVVDVGESQASSFDASSAMRRLMTAATGSSKMAPAFASCRAR